MRANEEVRKRHREGHPSLSRGTAFRVAALGQCAGLGGSNRNIQNSNPPTPYPVGNGWRIRIANANLSEANGTDSRAVSGHGIGYRFARPLAKWRGSIGSINQDIRIEENHGARVISRRLFQSIVGRSGASRIAFRHAFLLMRFGRSDASSRTRIELPPACCWTSKTAPCCPLGKLYVSLNPR